MPGWTRDAMDYLTDPEFGDITASLERRTWAGSTWAFSWCEMLGLTAEAASLERDLRRTGSIDSEHRRDLVEALQAKRQPTPAVAGGVSVQVGGGDEGHARPVRGFRRA